MRERTRQLYFLAWVAYITFSMLAFPFLRITVMLFSIPLTMLGGWFYRYKGALATTALIIPYHYLLVSFHSEPPSLFEALNPFGLGTAMVYSLSAAWLQSLRQHYQTLNNELEYIVAERTDDLRQLAGYLINMEYIDRSIITGGLLDNPFNLLESMQEDSELLYEHLKDLKHPETYNAKLIHGYTQQCRDQLSELINKSLPGIESTEILLENIQILAERMMQLGGGRLNIAIEGTWEIRDRETAQQIHHIVSEAIANAIRHARASQITIECNHEHGSTTITVENDGEKLPDRYQEGMGFPLMRHRAMSIGGHISIEGGADQRTRLICSFPRMATTDEKAFPRSGQRLNTTA